MKLYAPEYYKKFSCVADKCRHSCCVGWEIDVDEESMRKYTSLGEGYGRVIMDSIEVGDAEDCSPHIRLCEGERCPHLDERGLCRIITELGEEYLCDICREHPRFYNDTPLGKEVGLGMACEEASRLILECADYDMIEAVGGVDEVYETDFEIDATSVRADIYKILKDSSLTYTQKLGAIYEEYGISPSVISDKEWRELIGSLEYLDASHIDLFSCYSSIIPKKSEYDTQLERALAYFVFRHLSAARDEEEMCAALGFCLFCERLLASVVYTENPKNMGELARLARIVSEEIEYSEDNTDAIRLVFFGR